MIKISSYPTLCGSVSGLASRIGVALHDAGYLSLGLDYKYIAFGTNDIEEAVRGFRTLGFKGFAVSMPHKSTVINFLDEISDDVSAIGACNTVVNNGGKLIGHNTDWRGAIDAIKETGCHTPKDAIIFGSGGAAMAIAYGLKKLDCKVIITSRNEYSGKKIVENLNLDGWLPLNKQGEYNSSLLVNATPASTIKEMPIKLCQHAAASLLLDVNFTKRSSDIILAAKSNGITVIPGWRMLLHQSLYQFQLYTGEYPPIRVMSDKLEYLLF